MKEIVAYHGSGTKNLKVRNGLFFLTNDKANAKLWSDNWLGVSTDRDEGYIYKCVFSTKKPYIIKDEEDWDFIIGDEGYIKLFQNGYDCIIYKISSDIIWYILYGSSAIKKLVRLKNINESVKQLGTMPYLKNPSKLEFQSFIDKYQEVRLAYIKEEDTLYCWDSMEMVHVCFLRKMGYPFKNNWDVYCYADKNGYFTNYNVIEGMCVSTYEEDKLESLKIDNMPIFQNLINNDKNKSAYHNLMLRTREYIKRNSEEFNEEILKAFPSKNSLMMVQDVKDYFGGI